ncbi:MAG: HAMP domain-containing histidine kinase [Magnetococcales bacterium]|nr:HAMP domain-containing histidine kinase [Magnetococcales bacterium]
MRVLERLVTLARAVRARFDLWRQGAPLTLQALLVTGAAGILFWFVQDRIHSQRLGEIFQDHLVRSLTAEAGQHWRLMDERLRSQDRAVQLLLDRKEFVAYIERLEAQGWSSQESVPPVVYPDAPPWLPGQAVMRGFVHATHVVLADGRGRVREVYGPQDKPLPMSLLEQLPRQCAVDSISSDIREWQGTPHFLTRAALRGKDDRLRAILVFSTPLDHAFLISLHVNHVAQEIFVLLNESGDRVAASSRPDMIPAGASLAELAREYLVSGKDFTGYGGAAEFFLHFATLIPRSLLAELSLPIAGEGRAQRAIGHFLMILVFIGIVYWVGGRMRTLTGRMVSFAQERLGLSLSTATGANPLEQMEQQFALLAREIEEARRREAEYAIRLTNTNRELESSLSLVKRTHVQLLASEKMASLGGLVAGIAHEINNPVGIGVTAASYLEGKTRECSASFQAGTLSKSDLATYFQDALDSSAMILSNLKRAADLVRSFKQVAVDTSSEASRRFDFATLLHQILHSLHPHLKKTGHQLLVQCPEGLYHFGRPDVFSQIVTNLVLNSLQHGFDPSQTGEIRIEIAPLGEDEMLLRYADNGHGMTDEVRSRIFEPFFTTARGKGGSGLGMHIVFNLVTATLGGEIHCISTPGHGVLFSIRFPIRHAQGGEQP